MIAIFKKELFSFFNSTIGYLIVLLFLVLNGLFLWVFRQQFNVFDYGFADLGNFFQLTPWVFLFLIPAITMRSFSEEKKLGTWELLLIKPLSIPKIVLGKFLGVLGVGLIALLPTVVYVFAISELGSIPGNYDFGLVLGSYFGVVFLLALYCSIGLFCSTLSDNQIFAFIAGAALCFFVFYGPEAISSLVSNGSFAERLKGFGAKAHFEDVAKGVLDTRDLFYFVALTGFFIFLSANRLQKKKRSRMKKILPLLMAMAVLVLINAIASQWYARFDLTEDKRFTLSEPALQSVVPFESPVVIDILLEGNLPSEFAKLQSEVILILEQFQAQNKKIQFDLVNPVEDPATRAQTIVDLQQLGLKPASVTIEENGRTTQELVFPWAMVNHNNKTVKVQLLKNKLGATSEERINNSVQNLEYAFADAFHKLSIKEKKKIAVLKGNGELGDQYLADFLSSIREYYNIGAITLDSVDSNPQKVLNQLRAFDLALVAKPTESFSEPEKYVLDQFIVGGGKSLWLMDQVAMDLDSLYNETGSNVAVRRDLNLDDFFFKYGIRLNPVLLNDLYNTPIVLANGEANDSQYNPLPWVFHPMVFSKENHPINNNIEAIRLQFANTIDTLANSNSKQILLQSSPLSKVEGVPQRISFERLNEALRQEDYQPVLGYPVAVLVSGDFSSAYKNRVKPIDLIDAKEKGADNKMLVIADGDIIANQLQNGRPLELGYDKWTSGFYGNKEFLTNCVNYLLDDDGFINIRNKKVAIPLLDVEKIAAKKTFWQLITIGLPMFLTVITGVLQYYFRKRKFAA